MSTLLLLMLAMHGDGPFELRTLDSPRHIEVRTRLPAGITATLPNGPVPQSRGAGLLRLALDPGDGDDPVAIFSHYTHADGLLTLRPRFPLVPGRTYRVDLPHSGPRSPRQLYRVPRNYTRPAPSVVAIYPSSNTLPANQLKFYLHFSQPMREGKELFELIELLDEDHLPVAGPWRRTELWNRDATRLTLWFHPGRIKQGVGLRNAEGPVLSPGKHYTLRLPTTLRGADGQRLAQAHTKPFKVAAADHAAPNPQAWNVTSPRSYTTAPLHVDFGECLDRALAVRCLQVVDTAGANVPGTATVSRNETRWSFIPSQSWKGVEYRLHIGALLEDLAGNTPGRLFDLDLQGNNPRQAPRVISFRPVP